MPRHRRMEIPIPFGHEKGRVAITIQVGEEAGAARRFYEFVEQLEANGYKPELRWGGIGSTFPYPAADITIEEPDYPPVQIAVVGPSIEVDRKMPDVREAVQQAIRERESEATDKAVAELTDVDDDERAHDGRF